MAPTRVFSELAAEVRAERAAARVPEVPEWPQLTDLQMRAWLWLLGIPSPSLIHNGKKRRKV